MRHLELAPRPSRIRRARIRAELDVALEEIRQIRELNAMNLGATSLDSVDHRAREISRLLGKVENIAEELIRCLPKEDGK